LKRLKDLIHKLLCRKPPEEILPLQPIGPGWILTDKRPDFLQPGKVDPGVGACKNPPTPLQEFYEINRDIDSILLEIVQSKRVIPEQNL